ncbi:MAG: peroxiredoxin [Verrucomicrobiota bacterium]
MALAPGTEAPDFTLMTAKDAGDKMVLPVKLSDALGGKKVVLLFFPAAFTGVCTEELCDVSGGLGAYEELDAVVYGISTDSPFAQQAWAEKEGINVTLLSDKNHEVSKAYDVLLPGLLDIGDFCHRAVFVIGKDGKILHSEQTPSPLELPDLDKIKEALK